MSVRVGILDSGVCQRYVEAGCDVGYAINVQDGNIIIGDDWSDDIGHGTAIYYLIKNALKDLCDRVEIVNIKVFSQNKTIEYDDFVDILEYINEHDCFDFLNISSGIVCCGDVSRMQKVCNDFYQKNCVLIAAYDNEGAVSFPAALDNVIGVDSNTQVEKIRLENHGIVDVFCKASFMRVPGNDGEMTLVKGNSYMCPIVTAELIKEKVKGDSLSITPNANKHQYLLGNNFKMPHLGNSIVFPFNKEIHSIACNEDLINTHIVAYYSHRLSGQVGKKICEVIKWSDNNKIIHDIDNICWDDFDSIIMGHTTELEKLVKKDFKSYIVTEARKRGKKIYSFDPYFDNNGNSEYIYFPYIENSNVPYNYGKLFKTNKPILSIIGTSSRQGKFTLQLMLRRCLQKLGYKVGQIGTEPSTLLFGMDCVFPCGYNSSVKLNIFNTVAKINQMIYYLSQKDVDIIITGSQNAVITYNDNNINNYPLYHQVVLQSFKPDAMILCINPYDTMEYVEQTIRAAESLTDGKVIALVCFPYDIDKNWSIMQRKQEKMSVDRIINKKEECKSILGVDMYMLDDVLDQSELTEQIIAYFT